MFFNRQYKVIEICYVSIYKKRVSSYGDKYKYFSTWGAVRRGNVQVPFGSRGWVAHNFKARNLPE